jgi:hypothetical protein
MNTITTKQLRHSMAQVIEDLQNGKSVQLSYRRKIIGSLQPALSATPGRRGSAHAVAHFLKQADFGSIPTHLQHSGISFKQQINGLRQ